jgi:hypothetical protein
MPNAASFLALEPAAPRSMRSAPARDATRALRRFAEALLQGPADDVLALLADGAAVDDPRAGRVCGEGALRRYADAWRSWVRRHDGELEHVAETRSAQRSIAEHVLHLVVDGRLVALPLALVGERSSGPLSAVRVYHATAALTGRGGRPPLLASAPLLLPKLLRNGEGTLAAPGVDVEPCTVTDDGVRCALECNLVTAEGPRVARSGGLVVVERATGGRAWSPRLYHDRPAPALAAA